MIDYSPYCGTRGFTSEYGSHQKFWTETWIPTFSPFSYQFKLWKQTISLSDDILSW